MSRKPRRQFSDDFKQQIVDLHKAGMKTIEASGFHANDDTFK